MSRPPRLALVGTAGFGLIHLRRIRAAHERGELRLAAVCDLLAPTGEAAELLPQDTTFHTEVAELLATAEPDVTVVATPPHTHFPIAEMVLSAGSDLLVEKPAVLDMAAFDELTRLVETTGRVCQVGFQSFGSAALPVLSNLIASGELGELSGVGAAGAWVRTDAYYARTAWAGKRVVNGVPVVDGVLTNPFAHAVATALLVAGIPAEDDARITLELHRARAIEADDTSCVRVEPPGGPRVLVAATLCAEVDRDPYVVVRGSRATAVWHYKTDHLTVDGRGIEVAPPTDLLQNLLRHREDPRKAALLAPLSATRTFTRVVQAVRDAPPPRPIPPDWATEVGSGKDRRYLVSDIEAKVDLAAHRLALFSELGLPWADASVTEPPAGSRQKG